MGIVLRFIFFAIVMWLLLQWLKRLLGMTPPAQQQSGAASDAAPRQNSTGTSLAMRRCEFCKVHVPESEGVMAGGKFFCSHAHREQFLRTTSGRDE
jgi:uncharacterized protein